MTPQGTIAILWFDETTSNLLAITSSDGVTFSSPITVSPAVANTHVMDLTARSGPQGQIYAFWTQLGAMTSCSILFASSPDATTFTTAFPISTGAGSCNQTPFAIVDAGGNIDVSWDADGTSLFFSRSPGASPTFSAPVSIPTALNPMDQQLAVGPDGTIYVLVGAVLSRSTNGGATFSATSQTTLSQAASSLAVDVCSNVTALEPGNQTRTMYQRSVDGGVTFAAPVNISDLPGDTEEQLTIDGSGNVHIVWGVDGPPEIEYVRIPTTCHLP